MKKITEMNDQEILSLTQDRLEKMAKFALAESGIKILEYPQEPDYLPEPKGDISGWSIKGLDNVIILNKEVADLVSETLKEAYPQSSKYRYADAHTDDFEKFLVPNDKAFGKIEENIYYSNERFNSRKEAIAKNKELFADYQGQLNEYDQEKSRGEEITRPIFNRYWEVKNKYAEMDRMKARFEDYVGIADGDKEMALKFLKNAYNVDGETEQYITGEVFPTAAE